MNRLVLFGIAIFFAVVGLALVGAEKKAVAGHRCHGGGGCHGDDGCDGGRCHGDCGGRRCHGHHRRNRCHGRRNRCHGRDRCHGNGGCHGGHYDCGGGKAGVDMKGKGVDPGLEGAGGVDEPPPPPPPGEGEGDAAAEGTSAGVYSAPAYRSVAFRS